VIAVDPSTTDAGIATWGSSKNGTVCLESDYHFPSRAGEAVLVVVEDQTVRRGHPNPDSLLRLAQAAGATAARIVDSLDNCAGLIWVKPEVWKGSVPKPKSPHTNSPEHYAVHRRILETMPKEFAEIYLTAVDGSAKMRVMELVDAAGILASACKGSRL